MREDGSIASSNIPGNYGTATTYDYGLHYGMVIKAVFTDDTENDTGLGEEGPKAVVYDIVLMGGRRDGQVFYNVPMFKQLSGTQNFSETTLKPLINPTRLDPASELNVLPMEAYGNGDTVYIQFLDGNLRNPVIIALGRNTANAHIEATASDRQRTVSRFNGIGRSIDRDGVCIWTKDLGAFADAGVRASDPLRPLIEEFQPTIEQAVAVTIDNDPKIAVEYRPAGAPLGEPTTVTSSLILDFNSDALEYKTTVGLTVRLDGQGDEASITTAAGTGLTVSGATDTITLATAAGAAFSVEGSGDSVGISTTGGSILNLGAADATLATSSGTQVILDATSAALLDATGAGFKVSNGQIAMGNASAELMQVLVDLVTSFSTATYSGFGAPGSNVADIVQALTKLTTLKGTL